MKRTALFKEYQELKAYALKYGYRVRLVVNSKLKDYMGMNPLAAKELGFKMPDKEIWLKKDITMPAKYHTLKHELSEMVDMSNSMPYFQAHSKALKDEAMSKPIVDLSRLKGGNNMVMDVTPYVAPLIGTAVVVKTVDMVDKGILKRGERRRKKPSAPRKEGKVKRKAIAFAVPGDETASGKHEVAWAADGDLNKAHMEGRVKKFKNWDDAVKFADRKAKGMKGESMIHSYGNKPTVNRDFGKPKKADRQEGNVKKLPELKVHTGGIVYAEINGKRYSGVESRSSEAQAKKEVDYYRTRGYDAQLALNKRGEGAKFSIVVPQNQLSRAISNEMGNPPMVGKVKRYFFPITTDREEKRLREKAKKEGVAITVEKTPKSKALARGERWVTISKQIAPTVKLVKLHNDGDMTVKLGGRQHIVTPKGKVFRELPKRAARGIKTGLTSLKRGQVYHTKVRGGTLLSRRSLARRRK